MWKASSNLLNPGMYDTKVQPNLGFYGDFFTKSLDTSDLSDYLVRQNSFNIRKKKSELPMDCS